MAVADDAKAPLLHNRIKRPHVKKRLHDTRGHADDGDARNIINGKKYAPRRGGWIGPEHDRGLSPEPWALVCSAGRFALLPFPHAFVSPPPSSNIQGRLISRFGYMTTTWHASYAVQRTTP